MMPIQVIQVGVRTRNSTVRPCATSRMDSCECRGARACTVAAQRRRTIEYVSGKAVDPVAGLYAALTRGRSWARCSALLKAGGPSGKRPVLQWSLQCHKCPQCCMQRTPGLTVAFLFGWGTTSKHVYVACARVYTLCLASGLFWQEQTNKHCPAKGIAVALMGAPGGGASGATFAAAK